MFDRASLKLGLDKAVLQSMGGDKAANPVSLNWTFLIGKMFFLNMFVKDHSTSALMTLLM